MRLKQRFAKRLSGNQDIEGILEVGENDVKRISMAQHYNNDMQNPYKYRDHKNEKYHRLSVIIYRFLHKRIGRKFDDVYSEFINKIESKKEFKNVYNSRNLFMKYLNQNGLSVVSGVISKTSQAAKCKDIIIYKDKYETLYMPKIRRFNAARHLLIPILGYAKFNYYSSNVLTNAEYKKFYQACCKYLKENPAVQDNFKALVDFRDCRSYYELVDSFYWPKYNRPVERVIKYGTKEYDDYKIEQEKLKKQKEKEKIEHLNSFNDDFKKHNKKMKFQKSKEYLNKIFEL